MKTEAHSKTDKTRIDISVIIVNYKSWNHLKACLDSLKAIPKDTFTFEVITVDNASNDHQLEKFITLFPEFNFILNSGNNGFSHANNVGAKQANGDFFLFLNPDTIVNAHAISTMHKLAINNKNYGIISCSKLNNDGKPENEIRLFPKPLTLFGTLRVFYNLKNKHKIAKQFNAAKDIIFPDWVSGSIMFMSKQWFTTVSGWDEDYWLYLEDVDLCKKVANAGGKVALTRTTKIIHNHGGASRANIKTAALTKAEVIISKHVFINKHFKKFSKILAQFTILSFGLITKFLFAIIGVLFFFIPKLYVHTLLFINLIKYYLNSLIKGTWVSKRAPNYL